MAVTAGVKAKVKLAADLWRAKEGPKLLIARSGFNVSEERNRGLFLLIVLGSVAHVFDDVIK